MNIIQAIILGIVQGITEWLPISSSGHLVIFQNLFGLEPPVFFDIVLHIGSLVVVFLVFQKEIISLARDALKLKKMAWKYIAFMAIATIPIGLVGVLLNDLVKSVFNSNTTVGISLIITSLVLFATRIKTGKGELSYASSALIGLAQALAILPGVSRSGMTISAGLLLGIEREKAARFSFLIFIPAILGATIFEIGDVSAITNFPALFLGFLASIITGFVFLKILLKIIRNNRFYLFGWYTLVLGLIILLV